MPGFTLMFHSHDRTLRWAWNAALACFVIAGSTGAILRFSLIYGAPAGLQLHNLRHAHSHLMYFGWATPALMALIAANLPRFTGTAVSSRLNGILTAVFAAALFAFCSFLLFGYRPVQLGNAHIPLSMIAAALNVIAWYSFILYYWKTTRGATRRLSLRLWDSSLIFMLFASLGAWGLALANITGINVPLVELALTHVFLDLFADGWFLLALLGLAFVSLPTADAVTSTRLGENLLIIGLPLTFLISVPTGSLPSVVRLLAGASAFMTAVGLLILIKVLFKALGATRKQAQYWLWMGALLFLTMKAFALLTISLPAGAEWSTRMGLRVSYLHWHLLGTTSIGLLASACERWGSHVIAVWRPFLISVSVLLVSLFPMTRLWPSSWGGRWTLEFAAWAATGPVLVALLLLGPDLVRVTGKPASALKALRLRLTSNP